MRLHRLEMVAFGPYVDRTIVDFDVLGAEGLFLLHGETGAGKTMLLDAIAFALFGTVPGARGDVKRLRCDLADADAVPEVALELTLQGHRLRIVRSPAYDRPKRSGTGTTLQNAKATLSWIDEAPQGQPLEGVSRIDEVARIIQRLLGMNAAQFFQVVLLPQGDFARFLRAGTEEREQLLEQLFGTHRFGDVERWFRELRRERGREVEEARQELRQWSARFAQAAGEESPDEVSADWVQAASERAEKALEEKKSSEAHYRETWRLKEKELLKTKTIADRVHRVKSAHQKLSFLEEQKPERDRWATELSMARKAISVAELITQVDELTATQQRASHIEQEHVVRLNALNFYDTDVETSELRKQAAQLREQAGALSGLVDEADQQHRDREKITLVDSRVSEITKQVQQAESDLTGIPQQLTVLGEQLDEAQTAQTKLDDVQKREQEAMIIAEAAAQLTRAEQDVKAADEALRAAKDRYLSAKETRLRLRELRLNGMAAELAADLRDGVACSVCGSVEHPLPASAPDEIVTREQELAAEESEAKADQARLAADTAARQAHTLVAGLRERSAGRTEGAAVAELAEIKMNIASLTKLERTIPELTKKISRLEKSRDELIAQQRNFEQSAVQLNTEKKSIMDRIDERQRRLEQARGDFADVVARKAHLTQLAQAIEAFIDAKNDLAQTAKRLHSDRKSLQEALQRNGFTDIDHARQAIRTDDEISVLEQRLSEAAAAEVSARNILAEPELADISPEQQVDIESAQTEMEQARAQVENAIAETKHATVRLAEMRKIGRELEVAMTNIGPIEEAFAELDALTDVVNGRGQNARKMSLRSYVLAARLEEIVLAATTRLQLMSQGRYSLHHSDSAGVRGTRGGLELEVLDAYSGLKRPTKTLSGGESFLASLALALGLADVVAAETGGALLDTLFIDEGFGTLDIETLDVVMNVLDDLRAGGRVVGLVSHVEELRQRIPTRLRVRKSPKGSTVDIRLNELVG